MEEKDEVYNLCAFKGCTNRQHYFGPVLFRFPPKTNPRYEIWLENCGNKSILGQSEESVRKFALCGDHFSPDSFYDEERKKLRRDAVPEPYSPTFKRLYPLSKSNIRIYDHNYALILHEPDKAEISCRVYPLKKLNPQSHAEITNNNRQPEKNTVPRANLGSPRLKRDKPFVRTYTRKCLTFGTKDGNINEWTAFEPDMKSSSSIKSPATASSTVTTNSSRLVFTTTGTSSISGITSTPSAASFALSSMRNIPAKRKVRSLGGRIGQGLDTQPAGGVGLRDREIGILQETNNELKTQNKLLKKLNGQLKLKAKRCDERAAKLRVMLEKVCSVDGFLDLHCCMNPVTRSLIKAEIDKCKTTSKSV